MANRKHLKKKVIHFSCGKTGNEQENRLASLDPWYAADSDGIPHAPIPTFLGILIEGILEGPIADNMNQSIWMW